MRKVRVKTNVNERINVQEINVVQKFDEGFSKAGFAKKRVSEIIRDLELLKSKGVPYFRKVSKGLEMAYQAEVEGFLIVAWTSYIWSKGIFRDDDQIWVLIIDHRMNDPFFSFPINRWGDFFTRMFDTARVYKAVAAHWPTCPKCRKEKLRWSTIQSDEWEVIDDEFHNRTLYCGNKDCPDYRMDTKLYVTDIELPDKKDQRFFAMPFKRAQAERKRNRLQQKSTVPKRLKRYWIKLGIKLDAKPFPFYNDLEYEKREKGNKTKFYNEEAINDLLYYDERQNQSYTHDQ